MNDFLPGHSASAEQCFARSQLPCGMFERPAQTFDMDPRSVGWILKDEANPLNCIAHMLSSRRCVLDVGAGNGILPRLLRALHSAAAIDGVEPDYEAYQRARPHYRSVFRGDLAAFLASRGTSAEKYDAVVLADVIEHIPNPAPLMRQLSALLAPDGVVLVSTPNVAFGAVRLALLAGRFDYVSSGVLERTHLRFFTRSTLQTLVTESGYHLRTLGLCMRDPLSSEIDVFRGLPFMPGAVARLALDRSAHVYQFLLELELGGGGDGPLEIELGSRRSLLLARYAVKWLSHRIGGPRRALRRVLR